MKALVVAIVVVLSFALAAVAQEQLNGDEEVPDIYSIPPWSEITATFKAVSYFEDPATGELFEIQPGTLSPPHGVSVVTWDTGEEVPGPSAIVPPGFFSGEGLVYAGVELSNDLPTSTLRGITMQTHSLLADCAGFRREVAVSVARPGLGVFTSSDEFVGNPGIGHNLQVSFAISDCQPEAFYLELVDGEFQSFQTRVGIVFKDDGVVATTTFIGGLQILDGPFTLSSSVSPVPFAMESTYGYSSGFLEWPISTALPVFPQVNLDDLSTKPFQIVDPPAVTSVQEDTSSEGSNATTTTELNETTQLPTADTTAEAESGSFPWLPVAVGGVFVTVGGYFVAKKVKESDDGTDEESPAADEISEYFGERVDDPKSAGVRAMFRPMVDAALRNGAEATPEGWVAIDYAAFASSSFGLMNTPGEDQYTGTFVNQYTLDVVTRDDSEWNALVGAAGVAPGSPSSIVLVDGPAPDAGSSDQPTGFQSPTGDVAVADNQSGDEETQEGDPFGVFGDNNVDTGMRPITVSLLGYAIDGDEQERMQRLQNLIANYRGSGDFVAVAEALVEFNEWHQSTFDEDWFTWTNDSGAGTLVSAVNVDDFVLSRRMCCFEFVHFCVYLASDQLGRPNFSQSGEVADEITGWGLVPRLFSESTPLTDAAPRGAIITGVNRFWEVNTAGYFHVGISIGDGEIISLRSGGLTKEDATGLVSACFPRAAYSEIYYGDYTYGAQNPAPLNPTK